jgi:hypothetical protein
MMDSAALHDVALLLYGVEMSQAELRAEVARLKSQAVARYNDAVAIHNQYSSKDWHAMNVSNHKIVQEYNALIKEHYSLRKQADELAKQILNGKYLM